ncbi:MAG: hypothetical protein JSU65_13220 [Candidatus Zixiibacteriota bacterium]|nr:MAG: hypothetical protein JSU65_13220 [candidate division Zixibacteria bacterium]
MNCRECQDELLLYGGVEALPEELSNHLDSCEACRRYLDEISEIAARFRADSDLVSESVDVERFVEGVEARIGRSRVDRLPAVTWVRHVAYAASILLVAGIMSVGLRYVDRDSPVNGVPPSTDQDYYAEEELDEGVVDIVISDFSSRGFLEAGDELLNDVTEDELKYLEENFDVRNLLL